MGTKETLKNGMSCIVFVVAACCFLLLFPIWCFIERCASAYAAMYEHHFR